MSSPSELRWRSVPPDAIAWREWDGEFVVRNERSGSSHLLGLLAGRVLQVLLDADRALGVEDIAVKLSSDLAAADVRDRHALIEEVLSEFHRLGLAENEPR
ncbi:MAG TPA: HPr-rel-A system PqqD family peptide chaperone [Terriglobales bacterium]|nr:HPr-rel-A system PqqD family peptide chaperone [Terriglobales bacterium]